ncbi:hypothetical protein R3P38DRAFT_2801309 [Favolaschia claudopus]|uniref:Uncharacterized protein n=1 Tax=Favolaschia claudopus TaxID=2862362 RepID=A0AAV9ZVK4_9AGAR
MPAHGAWADSLQRDYMRGAEENGVFDGIRYRPKQENPNIASHHHHRRPSPLHRAVEEGRTLKERFVLEIRDVGDRSGAIGVALRPEEFQGTGARVGLVYKNWLLINHSDCAWFNAESIFKLYFDHFVTEVVGLGFDLNLNQTQSKPLILRAIPKLRRHNSRARTEIMPPFVQPPVHFNLHADYTSTMYSELSVGGTRSELYIYIDLV